MTDHKFIRKGVITPIHFTFCPICKQHTDESGFIINEPSPSDERYEDHGYKFCPACLSDAKDVMFEEEIPLSTSLLNLITVDYYRENPLVIEAAKKEEAKCKSATGDLFEKLGEIMKPVFEAEFAGVVH